MARWRWREQSGLRRRVEDEGGWRLTVVSLEEEDGGEEEEFGEEEGR